MNNIDKNKISLHLATITLFFCFIFLGYFLAYNDIGGMILLSTVIVLLAILIEKLYILIEEEKKK